jgi:hypothetical protein
MKTPTYKPVPASAVPANLVWITPRRNQGQIVEVSYSTGVPSGRETNYEADEGDPWQRTIDHADRSTTYARLAR